MNAATRICVLVAALFGAMLPSLGRGQITGVPWSQDSVKVSIAGCRASIIDNARRGYIARHNLTEDQLPTDFNERIAPVVEPFLLTCDCTIAVLAKEMPFEDFQSQSPAVQKRLSELLAKGGACEPKLGT